MLSGTAVSNVFQQKQQQRAQKKVYTIGENEPFLNQVHNNHKNPNRSSRKIDSRFGSFLVEV